MNNMTRILIVEDEITDYDLAQLEIRKVVQDCTFQRVQGQDDFLEALKEFQPHIILSDYKLPGFDGGKVLEFARQHAPLSPVIIWTGAMGEELAVECMKMGASDYVLKEDIKHLGHAVIQALKERDVLVERKQVEEKYQAIFENSPIGIFQSTPGGRFISVNPAMAHLYGYDSPQEMISSITNIAQQIYMAPEDRRAFTSLLEAQHVIENFEWKNTRKDGSIFWTSTSARTVCDEVGNILYYEGFLQDITKHKQAEERLRTSESRYRLATHATKDVIWEWDPAVNQLLWTENAQSVFGYSADEIGPDAAWWDEHIHPEDRERVTAKLNALTATVGGETVWSDEYRFMLKNGSYAYINDHAYIERDASGRTIRMIGAMANVTERKKAEEELARNEKRFRVLIEHGMDNISLLAEDGTLLWENPAINRTLGYEPGKFLSRNIFELMHPEDLGWTSDLFARLVREPGKVQPGTFRLKHHDGTWHWVEATATNMLEEPSVKAIVINYRDVTPRVEAEKRINDLLSLNEKVLNHSPLGILTYKVTGECVFANENAAKIVGTTVERLMLQNFHAIESWKKSGMYSLVETAISGKTTASGDVHHISTFGKDVWLAAYCVSFTLKNEEHILLSILDITERKQAEQALSESQAKYENLVETSHDLIWAVDAEGRITFLNRAAKDIYGYEPHELLGRSFFELMDPEHDHGTPESFGVALTNLDEAQSLEVYVRHRDGKQIILSANSIILRDESGKVIGVTGSSRDITEQKHAQETIRDSEKRLNLALMGARMGVWEWDLRTNSIFWSPECFDITGVKKDDFAARIETFTNLIHPDDVDRVMTSAKQATTNKSLHKAEFRILRPDGEIRWLSNHGRAEYDSSGGPVRLIGILQDITPTKRAETERQAVIDIMQGLAYTKDLQEFLKLVHQSLGKVIHAENCFVVLYHQESKFFEEIYSVDQYDPPAPPSKLEKSITSYVFRSGEPLLLNHESFDKLVERGEIELVGTDSASWLGVPLKTSNGTIGVIAVQDYQDPNRYSARDKDFLASVASQVALAIERKRAETELQQKNEDLGLLNKINEAVVRGQDLDSIVKLLSDELKRIFSTVGSTIYMLSSDKRSLTMQQYSFSSETAAKIEKLIGFKIPKIQIPIKEGGHFHQAMVSKQSAITTDPKEIQGWIAEFVETKFLPPIAKVVVRRLIPRICKLLNINSTIIVPLLSHADVLGFLDVSSANILTTRDLQRISNIGEQLALLMQRQQANERIRRSEEFLQGIQNSLSAHIAILDQTGNIVQVNSAWREYGSRNGLLSLDSCIGMNYLDVCEATTGTDAEVAHKVAVAIREALTGAKQETAVEYPCHSPQEKSWFTTHITCFDDGEQKWVVLAHENITTRMIAEASLKEKTAQFLTLFEASPDAIMLIEPQGNWTIVDCNSAACKMNGYSREELIGKSVDILNIEPATSDNRSEYMKKIKEADVLRYETTHMRRDGTVFPVEISTSLIQLGERTLVLGIDRDITERKQAEEKLRQSENRYRTVVENQTEFIVRWKADGIRTFANEAYCTYFGITPEQALTTNFLSLVHEEDRPAVEQKASRLLSGHSKVETETHRVLKPDGSIGWNEWTDHAIYDDSGQLIEIQAVGRDITERKRIEEAEREQRVLAEALRDTSQILSSSLNYREVLDHILTAVERVVPHDAATITLIEGEIAHVVRSKGYQRHNPQTDVMEVRLPLSETTNLREMVETKQPVVVHDSFSYPGWKRLATTDWLRSNVGAPILVHDEVIGFILLDSQIPGYFTPIHAERLQAFANQAALAIQNARLLQHAQDEIVERKHAEESLRVERERAQNYLDTAGVIMLALDRQANITLINQKGCEILGYSAEEVIGKNWIETFMPESIRAEIHGVFQHLISDDSEQADYYENTVLTKNGEERLIAWHNTIIRNPQGEIISALSSGEDITERKRAEQELRTSEERFSQLALNIEEAFWMTDAQTGRELYISPAAAAIWGNSVENILNDPDAFINSVMPEDHAHVITAMERQRKGEKTEIEYRVQRPDGSVRWVWDRAFPVFDEQGNVKTLAGIAADITERKQAEIDLTQSQARYQDLFDSSPISLWEEDYSLVKKRIESLQQEGITDLEEYFSSHPDVIFELASLVKVIDVNRASMELYNVGQKDELLRSLPEFVSDETLVHFQDEVLGLISRAKFEWEGEDHTLDGRKLIVMVNGSISPGHEVDWSKVIVSITDVTERKLAEERLRSSEDRYHALFQHLTDGFALHEIITDDQGKPVDYRFLEINPAFEKLTGLRAETTVGRRVNEILPSIENERFIAVYGKVALTGEPVHFEEYSAPLGKYYEISAYSPSHRQFAVTFVDVTERKQAEANLRKLSRAVEQSASTIVITDIRGDIEYVNPKFTEITGYDAEEVIGKNPRILKSGHTPTEEYQRLWTTISAGEEWRGELYNRKKNGELFWEQATISPIQNEYGEITHFIAVKEDISQRKQSEAEIQRHVTELQALYENGLAVGQLLEPHEIGARLIETFGDYLSWHHVTIRLLRTETDELELIAFNLPDLNNIEESEVENHFNTLIKKVGQGISGWVVQTGNSVRTGNVDQHPQYVSTQAGIKSGLYMPLKIGDRIIGVISVESEESDAFSEQDERLLATLATQAAIAFENARLYQAAQQEIAERERAQAALLTSETHYRELADSITEIMFELDQNLHYTHWNKASEAFSGITAEDAIGRSILDLFGESDDQFHREKIYRRVLTEQQAQTFETEVFPQGQRRILEINAYPSARGVSVVAKDITERRLSEALQQKRIALMEYSARHTLDDLMQRAIDEVSELTDSHIGFLHFVDQDQKALKLQAWSSETIQAVGSIEEKGMHYPAESAGVWADAVRQRRPIIHNDYESLPNKKGLPEGHVQVIRELVVPIIRDDRIAAVLGIGNRFRPYDERDVEIAERFADYAWDIIERKQMESALSEERNQLARRVEERTADLSRANSNLARALRVKDEFLANMSHELRTPLNAILGLSESLSEQVAGPLNEKQQKYLNTINESGHHLLSLINDILDLAKIEAGQISLDINKVDINSVSQASLRMIKQLAQKKNQEVLFDIESGIGLMWADERRLKQMIVNLLSNAVKFTPENGKLGLEIHGDEVGNRVLITVWDNGIGISNQDLDRLFKPFVQLDSGLAREATGTGLGLALVAQMARLHGGSVNVDSKVGEGSRFTLQLPWEPALVADAASRLRTTGKFRAIDIHAKNKPKILLIEDTREVVMMLADYLEMAGFTIITAQDGVDGLEQAKLAHPDLILMDIQMPRMDGFETTQKLRLDPEFKQTPIIALTALAMPNDRQRCLDAGMSEYISKPVNLKMLLKLIRSILFEKEGDPT